ncbi:MAG: oligosaccharide flippase family protein, partial [Gemmatimonadetes bacterium]|nr:oligosaccharide flippase family protein [Gemmatimonadota bacterium]
GGGYWTLVIGNLLAPIITTVSVVLLRRTALAWPRIREMKESLTFTRDQVVQTLSWYVYSNADFLVAGKVLGATPLGIYSLAWTLAQSVPEKIIGLVMRVTPAYFSAVQNDLVELRRYFLRLTEVLAIVAFPTLIGLALVTSPLVDLALEEKWAEMKAPLQILAIYAAYNSVTQLVSRVLTVRREMLFLRRIAVFLAVTLPFVFWFGSRWGPTGIALSWLTIHPLSRIPMLMRVSRVAELSIFQYLAAYLPALVSTTAMSMAVLGVGVALADAGPGMKLLLMISTGILVYLGTLFSLFGRRVVPLVRLVRSGVQGPTAGNSDPPE